MVMLKKKKYEKKKMYKDNLPSCYTKRILLSREQERELLIAAKAGYKEARDALVMAHLSYVVYLANRLNHPDMDTIEHGILGLLEAIDKFDLKMENRFSTFAKYSIIQKLIAGIHFKLRLTKMSRKTRKMYIEQNLFQHVELIEEAFYDLQSNQLSAEENIMKNYLTKTVRDAIQNLKDRERDIITRHLMEESCTLNDLGKEYGVSRERIRQIESSVLDKLRVRLKRKT